METAEKLKKFNRRLKYKKKDFETNWQPHFVEISDFITPRKGRFLTRDTKANDGRKRHQNIINNAAGRALNVLSAGLYSGLTPSSRPWLGITLEDKDLLEYKPVKYWLSRVRDLMLDILQKSNFYTVVSSVYKEMGGFGTGAMLIEEDPDTIVRFYPFTMGEYYISTNQHLRVNALYRIFWMTVESIMGSFKKESVSDNIKKQFENDQLDAWHQIVHLIEPNDDRIKGKEDSANKAWRSVYYAYKNSEDKLLRESGYDLFPVTAPRWDVTGSEIWGLGPGEETLADVKMLQKFEEKTIRALDKSIDPPMNAPTDLQNRGVSTIPGTVNYIDIAAGQNTLAPTYQVKPDFQSMEYKSQAVENRIKEGFYYDLFKMVSTLNDSPERTAYEIAKRHEEKLQLLGPMVERVQPEMLNPMVDRLYSIMESQGILPPIPIELDNMPLKIEYNSILAQAQKMIGLTSIEQAAGFISNLAQINPEVVDKMNFDEAVDAYTGSLNTPPSMIRTESEVLKIRKARLQKQQLAENASVMQQTLSGAKALSDINTGDNNALTQLMGGSAA